MKILQMLEPAVSLSGNRATTALRAGEILIARVEGFLGGGKVRLDIGGGRLVLAETSLNVQVGETVRVRVETPPGLIHLQAQSPDSSARPAQSVAGALKTLLSGGRTAAGLAPQLQELAAELGRLASRLDTAGISQKTLLPGLTEQIQSITKAIQMFDVRLKAEGLAGLDRKLDGVAVKEFIENSGLFLEARLAAGKDVSQDLKALLLKLRAALELLQNPGKVVQGRLPTGSSGDIQALAGSLRLATGAEIGDLESKQAMNLMAQDSGTSTTISIPLTGEFSKSELIISEEKEEKKEGRKKTLKRYRVTLSLDMSRLGHIRADAVQHGKSLAIGFAVKDDKTYRLVESHLEKLRAQIRAENLPVGEIFLRKAEPEPENPLPENSSLLLSRKA